MISKRQELILKVIVQEYTKTAQPVGSKRIVELTNLGLSTATIRNESAVLENLGYLEKQYTSSGRVPSSKGYRYYVDFLMDGKVDQLVFQKIEQLFADRTKSIDVIINESTKIISELTNLIAIVSKKDLQDQLKIKRIELIMLSDHAASVLFILSNGEIIQKGYYLDQQDINDLKISINLFNDNLIDTPINELINKSGDLEKVIGKAIKEYDFLLAKLLKALAEEMVIKKEIYGFKNVLINPEFSDAKKIEQI
jgi:heat-inducible transcriptional repressor